MAGRYRIEKNHTRNDSMEGAKPLEEVYSNSLGEAKRIMKDFADKGQFYAAVFIKADGECIDECGRGIDK